MKFLCVPCDTPMRLEQTSNDGGSVSLVYACPACGYECAMLTNPMETRVVASLGVKIGPNAEGSSEDGGSKCPFTAMVAGTTASRPAAGFPWTAAAEARIGSVPEFVRPMVRTSIEQFARDQGYSAVDVGVLEKAKDLMGGAKP